MNIPSAFIVPALFYLLTASPGIKLYGPSAHKIGPSVIFPFLFRGLAVSFPIRFRRFCGKILQILTLNGPKEPTEKWRKYDGYKKTQNHALIYTGIIDLSGSNVHQGVYTTRCTLAQLRNSLYFMYTGRCTPVAGTWNFLNCLDENCLVQCYFMMIFLFDIRRWNSFWM